MPNFAAIERRLNRATIAQLGNASALWWPGGRAAGEPVGPLRLVFDRETRASLSGLVQDRDPVASLYEHDMPSARRGDSLDITPDPAPGDAPVTLAFEVVRAVPDGTGLLALQLMQEGSL